MVGMAALIGVHGCATNPVTKKPEFVLMSEARERDTGRHMAPEIRKSFGVYRSDRLQEYVSSVGQRIAAVSHRPDLLFDFKVLDSPVVNAFALPGGFIFITRGLLAYLNSEAELAGVLAHEAGHVTARHAVRQYTKLASYQIGTGIAAIAVPGIADYAQLSGLVCMAITSGYSRKYEKEADRLAVSYVAEAGYDPRAVASLLKTLDLLDRYENGKKDYTSLFATHPRNETRIEAVEQAVRGAGADQMFSRGELRGHYLERIDGIVFGDDIEQGVLAGNRFQHPGFRIELFFPDAWSVHNATDAVTATHPEKDLSIQLRVHHPSKRRDITEAVRHIADTLGLEEIAGSRESINSTTAYVGSFSGRSNDRGFVRARVGFFLHRDRVFSVSGCCPVDAFEEASPYFEQTIRSFRMLSPAAAQKIQPNRVRLFRVKKKQRLADLMRVPGTGTGQTKTVSLLNGWNPDDPPLLVPGMIIKVIAAEPLDSGRALPEKSDD